MVQEHCSTVDQRVEWVSQLVAQSGTYGVVSHLSQTIGVSRQTLYSWKTKGRLGLEQALTPVQSQGKSELNVQVERAILTLLVEGPEALSTAVAFLTPSTKNPTVPVGAAPLPVTVAWKVTGVP